MVLASLWINLVVLVPVCLGLLLRRPAFDRVFGKDSTARQILLCMYIAILSVSLAILFFQQPLASFVVPLLTMQIIYKLASVILIKDKSTPVLWFNLMIAIFHGMTVFTIQA